MTLALDFAIDCLMQARVGRAAIADVFREALFYNVPSRHTILHDQDFDLDRHVDTQRLGFRSGGSLVDERASHLRVKCSDDYNTEVVEVYNFQDSEMEYILKGDCKMAHSLRLWTMDLNRALMYGCRWERGPWVGCCGLYMELRGVFFCPPCLGQRPQSMLKTTCWRL